MKKFLFFNCLAFIYLIIILKYSLNLYINFDFKTKLLLYDLSPLLGGVQKFNNILLICVLVFGFSFVNKYHLGKKKNLTGITKIIEIIGGTRWILFKPQIMQIYKPLNKFAMMLYRLLNLSVLFFGEPVSFMNDQISCLIYTVISKDQA